MNELKPKNTQESIVETENIATNETNWFARLLQQMRQKNQFLPWLIALILVVCVVALFLKMLSRGNVRFEL